MRTDHDGAASSTSDFLLKLVPELLERPTEHLAGHLLRRLRTQYGAKHACIHLHDSFLTSVFPETLNFCPPGEAEPEERGELIEAEGEWHQCAAERCHPISMAEAAFAAPGSARLTARFNLSDGIVVPLHYQGEYLGVLNLYLQHGAISPETVEGLVSLGGILYGLIKRSQMERRLIDRNGIIKALTRAVEAKDPYTGGHLERVRDYARNLAQAIDLAPIDLVAVEEAAYLHDIGKIQVPDNVLQKRGSLTPIEWAVMKQHPMAGNRFFDGIQDSGLLRAIPGILFHHERFAGGGYPQGLVGEEIPLIARIIAVADAYDAMTSNRPYRQGLSHESAAIILREESGRQFDPNLVEQFLSANCHRRIGAGLAAAYSEEVAR